MIITLVFRRMRRQFAVLAVVTTRARVSSMAGLPSGEVDAKLSRAGTNSLKWSKYAEGVLPMCGGDTEER